MTIAQKKANCTNVDELFGLLERLKDRPRLASATVHSRYGDPPSLTLCPAAALFPPHGSLAGGKRSWRQSLRVYLSRISSASFDLPILKGGVKWPTVHAMCTIILIIIIIAATSSSFNASFRYLQS